jgi:lysozyme
MAALIIIGTMNTSQAAINKIKASEGFSATAYPDGQRDGVQLYSIGYGHQIQPNELHLKTETITVATGEKLLRSDIAPLELQINQAVPKGYNQNQFDASLDFGYNCGSGALSSILKVWTTTHSTDMVTAKMKLYVNTHDQSGKMVKSQTLVARRKENALLFTKPYVTGFMGIAVVGVLALGYVAFT